MTAELFSALYILLLIYAMLVVACGVAELLEWMLGKEKSRPDASGAARKKHLTIIVHSKGVKVK